MPIINSALSPYEFAPDRTFDVATSGQADNALGQISHVNYPIQVAISTHQVGRVLKDLAQLLGRAEARALYGKLDDNAQASSDD